MPLPVDYQTCLVTGEWVNIATGEPGVGYVKFTPRATRITTQSEVIVLPTVRRVWLVGGVISEAIPATDDPQVQPLEWTYQVTEVINGVTYPTYDIEAPVGGTVDLSSVAGVGSAGTIVGIPGPPGPGAVLSNDPAQALGTASAGVGAEGSRDDHVHPMPDASDVGADPAGTAAAAVAAIPDDGPDATPSLRTLGWFAGQAAGGAAVSTSLLTMSNNIADHHAETTTAHGGIVASTDPRLTDARTPTAHEASHHHDGSDPLSAADVGAVPVESVGLLPGETNRGTWDVAATYAVGDVVCEVGDDLYVATAPSTGAQPSLTPGSWDVLDPTVRHVRLGPGATSGDYATAVGLGATSGDYGLSVGLVATAGDNGTAVGPSATSGVVGTAVGYVATAGDNGTAVGPSATAGDNGTAVGYGATAGDNEVNLANTYRATLDPGDQTTPLTATIATGHVDLPETADVTNPPADHQRLVARTDGLYVRDQTGTEVGPLGAAHAASHQDGGSDELALDGSQITSGTVAAARLGSGTASAGTVLHGDGVGGAAWTTAPARAVPLVANGEYCAPVLWAATSNHGLTAVGRMALSPVVLPAGTATRLTVSITANAASTWRLGLYPAGASGLPDGLSPVVDGGTISTASGNVVYASISKVLPAGLYWAAALCEAYTAAPTVYGSGGAATGAFPVLLPQTSALNGAPVWTLLASGVSTGALPACPTMTFSYNAPRVTVRMT